MDLSKIIDKLGIYDLTAVLLSGISLSTFSLLILQNIYNISFAIENPVPTSLAFIVISYFIGLIFQELGSIAHRKLIYANNKLLLKSLKTAPNSNILLTYFEKQAVYSYVTKVLNIPEACVAKDNIIYNYCKHHITSHGSTTKIDKDQALSAMSRSFSIYFVGLALFALFSPLFLPSQHSFPLFIVSALLACLLFYRSIRFAYLRHIYIIRTFYYDVVVADTKNKIGLKCTRNSGKS